MWYVDFPVCAGRMQSPVSIDTAKVILDEELTMFNLRGYDNVNRVNMTLQNNGHTVQVDLMGNDMNVSGGGVGDTFRAKQFHFHWGSEDRRGSEHDINGVHYPMEMHVVHYNARYQTFQNAVNKSDGLLVLGFLFEVGNHNHHFDQIIHHFYQIAHKDDHVNLPTFPLRSLFPDDMSVYYRYRGSLTTPPCFESVLWTIFKTTIKISEDQLMKFRHNVYRNYANETIDRDISDDFRPAQALNDRFIYASHSSAIYRSASCKTTHNVVVLTLVIYLTLLINVFQ
ncbi:hypothetical protein FSP39_001336 [Pinctada imbricata]|uniref:Carbonic anhydrase n=1 Tax=Pinctada imbricata TaxID=66713 RepID=A0AA89BJT4_PINIB|nr:hypothetical protein FSP39_001336 [Pinctada imbricata]